MALDIRIDRRSKVPLYFQLAQQLEEAIRSGQLAAGDRIDTEVEIAQAYGLSRPTVRQAIQELVSKGLVVRRRGVGTQVVHSQLRRPVELTSLFDDLSTAHRKPRTQVLALTEGPAEADIAAALGLAPGDDVLHVRRLRSIDSDPLAIMENWIPRDLLDLSTDDLETGGLYELMRRAGITMRVATQSIGARAASAAEARLLKVRTGAPLLTMQRTTFDDTGRAVEYAAHAYRADGYTFETTLIER